MESLQRFWLVLLVLTVGVIAWVVFGSPGNPIPPLPTSDGTDNHSSELTTCERLITRLYESRGEDLEVPAGDIRRGPGAEPDFSSWSGSESFRTRIAEASREGANFAGRYVVASWGCGTSCQQHAVVDARDGRIVSYGQLVSELDVDHEIENKILITNPRQNVMPPGSDLEEMEIVMTAARTPRQYWELREADGRGYLNLLCTESAAEGVYELD